MFPSHPPTRAFPLKSLPPFQDLMALLGPEAAPQEAPPAVHQIPRPAPDCSPKCFLLSAIDP